MHVDVSIISQIAQHKTPQRYIKNLPNLRLTRAAITNIAQFQQGKGLPLFYKHQITRSKNDLCKHALESYNQTIVTVIKSGVHRSRERTKRALPIHEQFIHYLNL